MIGTVINQLLMERYKQLVEMLYTEPKEEKILGTFLQLQNWWTRPGSSGTKAEKETEVFSWEW